MLYYRRDMKFRQTMRGISSKTLAIRLKELQKGGILERQACDEIPATVEYRLTIKGVNADVDIVTVLIMLSV
jgi:DNA-binding HxlR family transcriptional regulator